MVQEGLQSRFQFFRVFLFLTLLINRIWRLGKKLKEKLKRYLNIRTRHQLLLKKDLLREETRLRLSMGVNLLPGHEWGWGFSCRLWPKRCSCDHGPLMRCSVRVVIFKLRLHRSNLDFLFSSLTIRIRSIWFCVMNGSTPDRAMRSLGLCETRGATISVYEKKIQNCNCGVVTSEPKPWQRDFVRMSVVVPTVPPPTVEGSEFQISGGQIVLILCGLIASGKVRFFLVFFLSFGFWQK